MRSGLSTVQLSLLWFLMVASEARRELSRIHISISEVIQGVGVNHVSLSLFSPDFICIYE